MYVYLYMQNNNNKIGTYSTLPPQIHQSRFVIVVTTQKENKNIFKTVNLLHEHTRTSVNYIHCDCVSSFLCEEKQLKYLCKSIMSQNIIYPFWPINRFKLALHITKVGTSVAIEHLLQANLILVY